MGAVASAWLTLGETDRQLLADLGNAAAQYVRSLGASTAFPTLFASSSGDTVATWERAYDSAVATVAGPSVGVLAGQSGSGAGAPDWSAVLAAAPVAQRPALSQLAQAHQAIQSGAGVLRYSVSDGPLRAWVAARSQRDVHTGAPVTTPVVPAARTDWGKVAIGALIVAALSSGGRR